MTAESGPVGPSGVAARFAGEQVVLAVRGEVRSITVLEVGAVLEAVIDLGYLEVVLDLGESDHISPVGLRAIELGAARLWSSGGSLTLRSASLVRERLAAAGLSGLVRWEGAEDHLGPEQSRNSREPRSESPPGPWPTLSATWRPSPPTTM